jgi:hypothetical protein
MANKRISQLQNVTSSGVTPYDLLAIVNYDVYSGTTKNIRIPDLKSYINSGSTDTYVTGYTYQDNTFTISDSSGNTFSTTIDTVTGLTVNGTLSATTISGVTFYGDGSNLTGIGEYTYEIGEYVPAQGGVIFHRYKDGCQENYLVVAKSDAATSASWDNRMGPGQPPMLMNTSSWNGASNYLTLAGSTGSQFTSAAYAVTFYNSVVPISGWYLPAIDELNLLYNNRFNVNRTLSGNSSFGSISGATEIINENYWSSTERNQTEALIFNFGIAGTYTGAGASMKTGSLRVRAIRKFSI